MPVKSQAQRRFMYAVEEGKVPGVKKSVGEDFINASHGLKALPEHVKRPFHNKRTDGRPQTGGPQRKKVRRGANDGGPSSFAGPSFSGTGGQGNTSTKGQFSTSNP